MKLREYKDNYRHFFKDGHDQYQGEYKAWYSTGQQRIISHFRDGKHHGEFKRWNLSGKLDVHTFDIDGEEIIDFLENPDQYPATPEEKTMFVLKYGNAPFIGDK